MKTQEIDVQRAALEQQLAKLNNDRIAAEQAEYDAKHDQIAAHEDNAEAYRKQALKVTTDEEKQNCYRYAEIEEQQANDLRIELGLAVPEPEPQPEPIDPQQVEQAERVRGQRAVNSLLLIAICTGLSYAITDYTAGQIEAGLISFLLVTVARISYAVASVFAASWLALRLVAGFIPNYAYTRLKADFMGIKPTVRLWLLAIILVSVMYFLSNLAHVE